MLPAQPDLVHHLGIIGRDCRYAERGVVFVDAKVAFREDDDFTARDVVLFEGFADDAFGDAVGINVGLVMEIG